MKIQNIIRMGLMLAAVCSLLLPPALAQEDNAEPDKPDLVRVRDKQTNVVYIGEVIEEFEGGIRLQVYSNGKPLYVKRFLEENIASIEPYKPEEGEAASPSDAYILRKKEIDTQDAEQLYGLARWVWRNHADNLDLLRSARSDLQSALRIDADHTRSKLLLEQVEGKIRRLSPDEDDGGEGEDATDRPAPGEIDFVSDRDILWIRLKELQPDDRVGIRYKNDVLKRYIEKMEGLPLADWDDPNKKDRFLRMSRIDQVMEILDTRPNDTDLLKDIHIVTDPQFMVQFQSQVQPLLLKNCGTGVCHGGANPGGGLKFYSQAGKNATYTNFVIVSGYVGQDGRMLDRQNLERSLLLQYALDPKAAVYRHPGGEIKTPFRSKANRQYRRVLRWMESLKGPITPEYHLEYKPPEGMNLQFGRGNLIPDRALEPEDEPEDTPEGEDGGE